MNEAEYVEQLRRLSLDDEQIEKARQAALDLAATYPATVDEAVTRLVDQQGGFVSCVREGQGCVDPLYCADQRSKLRNRAWCLYDHGAILRKILASEYVHINRTSRTLTIDSYIEVTEDEIEQLLTINPDIETT